MENQWAETLRNWSTALREKTIDGACASYIPALAKADPKHLGVCILGADGDMLVEGEADIPFSMQSISKVISFIATCVGHGIDKVLEWVDVEPTGDAFNSIVRLELNRPGKPFNPMINAGAITVASILPGETKQEKLEYLLQLLERILAKRLQVNQEIFESEWETAHRNRALAHYVKEMGFLGTSVEDALEVYIKQCSIELTVRDLAEISLVLAHDGYHPLRREQIIPADVTKVTKALMLTCGMYNSSGKFAAFVGVPAKSGVSGGIMAVVPPRCRNSALPFQSGCGIGIYGPAIDANGNSVLGVQLLKQLSHSWDFHVF